MKLAHLSDDTLLVALIILAGVDNHRIEDVILKALITGAVWVLMFFLYNRLVSFLSR